MVFDLLSLSDSRKVHLNPISVIVRIRGFRIPYGFHINFTESILEPNYYDALGRFKQK